jgi:putative DNA primase/helicase
MVFSCNQFPRLADTTPGFMRRLFPVEFNAVFSASDPDYDPMIGEKLREEETLEYACAIGVEGLRRVIEQHQPTPNEMSESMKSEIAREGNTGLQWFNDDNITADHLIGMTKEEAYREYVAWCERNGYSRTALGSGALSAQIGTYFRLKCTKSAHREYANGRKTVRVYEPNAPSRARG